MATTKRARVTSSEPKAKKGSSKSGSNTQQVSASGSVKNLTDEIRVRAYQLWEQNGRPNGQDIENWLRAEHEVVPSLPRSTN